MYIIKTGTEKHNSGFRYFCEHIFKDHVLESAATLSYYFLFSVFPLTILISASFSTLNISQNGLQSLNNFIPNHILRILESYLEEISQGNTASLILVGIALTLYSMGKVIQTMKRKFRLAYGVRPKLPFLSEWFVSLIFVLLVMLSFYAMLIVIVAGNYLFRGIVYLLPFLSDTLPTFQALRLLGVAAYLFFVLLGLYYVLPGIRQKVKMVLPGTAFALSAWVLLSYLFSYFVENFSNFTSLYGSLGAIIALLTWLYFINLILLGGAYINAYLYRKSRMGNNL